MTIIPIWWQYLTALSIVVMIVFIIGIVILAMCPSKKFKIAAFWIATGLLQITLWGFLCLSCNIQFFSISDSIWIILTNLWITPLFIMSKRSIKDTENTDCNDSIGYRLYRAIYFY